MARRLTPHAGADTVALLDGQRRTRADDWALEHRQTDGQHYGLTGPGTSAANNCPLCPASPADDATPNCPLCGERVSDDLAEISNATVGGSAVAHAECFVAVRDAGEWTLA